MQVRTARHSGGKRETPPPKRPWGNIKVTVVIPALNEAKNLPLVLPRIPAGVDEVILVDGQSTDGTPELAMRLRPNVRVLSQSGHGKGAALREGFASSTGDIVVMLDADGSMDPKELPTFVRALLTGADMVKGSRFVEGGGTRDMPFHRKVGNGLFVVLVNALFRTQYTDMCYGYCAFWRKRIPELGIDTDGFEIETLLNIRATRAEWVVREVPSFESARVHGAGRLRTFPDGWRVLTTIVREAFDQLKGRQMPVLDAPSPAVAVQEAT